MKTKKLIPFLSLALCFACFGGCTSDQKLDFNNYWNYNSLVDEDIHETLVYDVVYEKGSGLDAVDYELDYSNGKYTTELTSVWENGKFLYFYKTELTIDATYTLGSESATLQDSVVTESRFYASDNALRPISSYKKIVSSSPVANGAHEKASECYQTFSYSVTTTYDEDLEEGNSVIFRDPGTENEKEYSDNDFEIDEDKYRYLDNEQLLFALRGVSSSTTSAKVLVYSPFVDRVQNVSISFSSDESQNFSFYKNGSEEKQEKTITYRPVSVVLDEQNPGGTQTAWIAKTTTSTGNGNEYRNVMLRLETPISYSLGTLIYKLNSVSYE